MKKKLIILATLVVMTFTACGGNATYTDESGIARDEIYGRFIVLSYDEDKTVNTLDTNWLGTYTVYDKNTKAMYYIIDGFRRGGIVPVYNEDGTIKFYNGTN